MGGGLGLTMFTNLLNELITSVCLLPTPSSSIYILSFKSSTSKAFTYYLCSSQIRLWMILPISLSLSSLLLSPTNNFGFSDATFVALRAVGWRHGLQVIAASTSTLFFLGMFYRSASLYHPQRRAILHLKDMSKKKGKDKNKIENKPPYFDFATLRLRSLQVYSSVRIGKRSKIGSHR